MTGADLHVHIDGDALDRLSPFHTHRFVCSRTLGFTADQYRYNVQGTNIIDTIGWILQRTMLDEPLWRGARQLGAELGRNTQHPYKHGQNACQR